MVAAVNSYAVTSATFRTPRGQPADMLYREGTNDWNTLNACMTEDEYSVRGRHFSGTALDVGAYLGGVAISLALDNPELRVVAIEPVPSNADLTRQNVTRNGLDGRVTVIEGAVGNLDPITVDYGYRGSESADHHAFVGNSSFGFDNGIEHESVTFPPTTLSSLIAEHGHVGLIKIDCEGGEYAFLSDPAVASVDLILGEWHPVQGKTIADVMALLPDHTLTFTGPQGGPGGFEAVAK